MIVPLMVMTCDPILSNWDNPINKGPLVFNDLLVESKVAVLMILMHSLQQED
jgi:hypothetical protein